MTTPNDIYASLRKRDEDDTRLDPQIGWLAAVLIVAIPLVMCALALWPDEMKRP